ncbi:LysR family transcriptional regulator [Salinicola rhizosphaerae]|uniref:LysR family transcriptional regulator n=1 Tax=Salinicola rhizosphaerae TaxID=1443141 RepID=A0ABQ3DPP3_9GAMM|nr:LysR family transcriptional regulator [Salinicola rhizosphaerae]GHB07593.1 LysR family transcriptional regulator [Salinicola rhizosphaerae]
MINPQWALSFATLVEQGSFTRAAAHLDLTQAAVSQHIRHLEQHLGPLLLRRSRKLELTPAGEAMLVYCRDIDAAARRLQVKLEDRDTDSGEISLITPGSVGLRLYPILLDLQAKQPHIAIRHRFAPDYEVIDAVSHNRFELGLVTLKPEDQSLTATPFLEEALELVLPANADVSTWQDLERLGFIDHPDGKAMATRLLARRFPGNPGFDKLPKHGFINQIGLILEPVARGFGFTVVPRYAREAFHMPAAIKVFPYEKPIIDTLWLIHRAEWPLTARTRRVLESLSRQIASGPDLS